MPPAITIILPTFNRAHFLREALCSLRLQLLDRREWRVVVLDNASTDATRDVVSEFSDLPLVYDPSPTNEGADANFARGLVRYLDTEFFAILCDDDLYAPYHLELALRGLRANPEAGLFANGTIWGAALEARSRGICDSLSEDALTLDMHRQTIVWDREAWLVLHTACSPVVITGCLFRASALRAMSPILTPGVFLGDRWLLARFGQQHLCVTSPWPATFIRLHGQNGYMGVRGERMAHAHQQCGNLILSLCESEKIDVVAFWKKYGGGTVAQIPEPLKAGIHDCYPEVLRRRILGSWRPSTGMLSRLGVPMTIQPAIRKMLRIFGKN
jgi:hypothetical protein